MEQITEKVNSISINDDNTHKRNRIQVSNTKKPLFFYVNLAKQYGDVELSALRMAISTVVTTITEILKNNGFVIEKSEEDRNVRRGYKRRVTIPTSTKA